jgi:hypothetical protein
MEPYDPMCLRYASEMYELDSSWALSQEELDETSPEERRSKRIQFVLKEEGTLNPTNNHFLCNNCYIIAGMPTAPGGWICP